MGGSFISQKAKHFCTSDGTIELRAPSPLRIERWTATEKHRGNEGVAAQMVPGARDEM